MASAKELDRPISRLVFRPWIILYPRHEPIKTAESIKKTSPRGRATPLIVV